MNLAELDLEFTQVKASVDGYVTNLNLRLGSQVVENQPALALVDVNSYWVDAYFRETYVGSLNPGDVAVVTLMSYPDTPLTGRVESIGWGIAPATAAPTVVCMLPVFLALGGMNLRTDQNLFLGWFEPRMTQSETWLSVVSVRGFIFGVYFFDCHSKGRS